MTLREDCSVCVSSALLNRVRAVVLRQLRSVLLVMQQILQVLANAASDLKTNELSMLLLPSTTGATKLTRNCNPVI